LASISSISTRLAYRSMLSGRRCGIASYVEDLIAAIHPQMMHDPII
jgi:hypothetical protein